ncbi:MAG: NADH-ubiquinone oxidoreductase-F iron-sulfur binding region domain-containing protein [Pseudomonadota bacterium]
MSAALRALARYENDPRAVLQVLRAIQLEQHGISAADQAAVAGALGLPRTRVQALIDFYSYLHDRHNGNYELYLSDSITDRMLGNGRTAAVLRQELHLDANGRSSNGQVTLTMASCTGLCERGPALLANGHAIQRVDAARARRIAGLIAAGVPVEDWPGDWKAIDDIIERKGPLLDERITPGGAIERAMTLGPRQALAEIGASGLRGCGGAGFPTHRKWEFCRDADADQRFVVCNADEGEPGTFKDRALLNGYAGELLEGMAACAVTVGASMGYIYLRHEYEFLRPRLQEQIEARRAAGLLGRNLLGHHGTHFDVEIYMGAGSYVCGEESALLESLEGKRGIPRIRPPFPVTRGLWGKPTVVNNVETLCYAAGILEHGAAFTGHTGGEPGWKLLSISGDCARPGIYELPLGTPVAAILDACGAQDAQAIQVGGPGGTLIAASEADRRLSFEDLNTGGSFMVFDASRDLLDVATNFTHFFAHESCGFCTPCRVGTKLMAQMADKIADGHGARLDLDQIHRLNRVMTQASHCGLGQRAAVPIIEAFEKFPASFQRRMEDVEYKPAFDVEAAIERSRAIAREEETTR